MSKRHRTAYRRHQTKPQRERNARQYETRYVNGHPTRVKRGRPCLIVNNKIYYLDGDV